MASTFANGFYRLCRGAAIAVVALLAGCEPAPTDAALTTDLTAYVESGFAAGLLEVTSAERNDTPLFAAFKKERRVVPFAAELRLKRNHDFSTWDQANARTLIYLLGAAPEDLTGMKPDGNKTGDVLHLNGSVIYTRSGETWRLEAGTPRPETTTVMSPGRWPAITAFGRMGAELGRALGSDTKIDAAFHELMTASKKLSARLARGNSGWALASGPKDGGYWRVVDAAAAFDGQSVNVTTTGSRENLLLLREGAVTAAIVRSSEASLAAAGTGPFNDDGTFPTLRALASLFPEHIHVAVMVGSPASSVADLYGKRVTVAARGPAAGIEAGDVLRAHRVPLASLAAIPKELPLEEALAALSKGETDAVIITSPAPAPAVRDFALAHPLRFLPLDADAIALMTTGTSNYVAMTMPAQTYPGQNRPVATVGVTALLVSTTAITPAETEGLLKAIFAGVDYMGHGSALGAMIHLSSAQSGLTLPLHPGAEAFFQAAAGQK